MKKENKINIIESKKKFYEIWKRNKNKKPILQLENDSDFKNINIPKEMIDSRGFKKYIYGQEISKLSYQYLEMIWRKEWNKSSAILIRMLLRNGKTTEFIVNPKRPVFIYQDGAYIIDSDYLVEDVASGMYSLQYHQDISVPIRLEINIDLIKKELSKNNMMQDVSRNINPNTLKDVVISTVIQKAIAGGQLESQLRTLFYLIGGSLILSFFTLLVLGYNIIR